MKKPRDPNAYPATCYDCGCHVDAGAGALYRHSGANLPTVPCKIPNGYGYTPGRKAIRPKPGKRFLYHVRCAACAEQHDGPALPPETSNASYQAGYAYACGYHD